MCLTGEELHTGASIQPRMPTHASSIKLHPKEQPTTAHGATDDSPGLDSHCPLPSLCRLCGWWWTASIKEPSSTAYYCVTETASRPPCNKTAAINVVLMWQYSHGHGLEEQQVVWLTA